MPRRSLWLPDYMPGPRGRLRLFCFSYAGGSSMAFSPWRALLPEEIETCAVQLPGRQSRLNEPLPTDFGVLLDAIAEGLQPYFDRPLALFGHSLGALLAFELTRRLQQQGDLEPAHLFVSGCSPPQFQSLKETTYDLPDDRFESKLQSLGGLPQQLLRKPALKEFFFPAIRSDFRLFDLYDYQADQPLACPLTVHGGEQDSMVPADQLPEWREHTRGQFRLRMFPGGHFFINEQRTAIVQDIAKQLRPLLAN